MREPSKTAAVIKEMKRYKLDVLGISECRWTGSGTQLRTDRDGNSFTILYSGRDESHESGVALIVSKDKMNTLLEWEPVSDRILRARFNSKFCKLTIIQCYAPTNDTEDDHKDDWYEQLQATISKVPLHDMVVVMGDLNAKVGADNKNKERAMGSHGCGVLNNNGERLVEFCLNNNLVIGGTIFPHKQNHKLTWVSPDKRTVNQIDHILINNKWRTSLQDVRVYRGADAYSDHYLVKTSIKLKLRKTTQQTQKRKVLDMQSLQVATKRKQFVLEVKNRFSCLEFLEDKHNDSVQDSWNCIKEAYVETAKDILGYRKGKHKEWLSAGTWDKIEERKKLKEKLLTTKSQRVHDLVEQEYKNKDKEVKKSAKKKTKERMLKKWQTQQSRPPSEER